MMSSHHARPYCTGPPCSVQETYAQLGAQLGAQPGARAGQAPSQHAEPRRTSQDTQVQINYAALHSQAWASDPCRIVRVIADTAEGNVISYVP